MPEYKWLTDHEVAKLLGRSTDTVRWWRLDKKGPPYYRMAGRIRYRLDEVEAWLVATRIAA